MYGIYGKGNYKNCKYLETGIFEHELLKNYLEKKFDCSIQKICIEGYSSTVII